MGPVDPDLRPRSVRIVEVAPRDGLQSEAVALDPGQRAAFVEGLVLSGARHVEVGSFVSPRRVPQMAGTAEVFACLHRHPETTYSALAPNRRGLDDALAADVDEVAVFGSATEAFSQMNLGCSIAESLDRFAEVFAGAHAAGKRVRGYVSCVIACPYEGMVEPERVRPVVERLLEMGCYEVSLGDTIGRGDPDRVGVLIDHLRKAFPVDRLAVHFHDTYGLALANVVAAVDRGIAVIDASAGGIGGCPHAPGAAGNLATEDLIWLLDGLGIGHGHDLGATVAAAAEALDLLGTVSPSRVHHLYRSFARPSSPIASSRMT